MMCDVPNCHWLHERCDLAVYFGDAFAAAGLAAVAAGPGAAVELAVDVVAGMRRES